MISLGVLADTHVPDRMRSLNPHILPIFREAQVEAILHAGDVCVQSVLDELSQVAPVYAVGGNRDLWALRGLPKVQQLTFGGVQIVLTHGHIGLLTYLEDKIVSVVKGLEPDRYINRLVESYPYAGAIVFGHIHTRINLRIQQTLVFNPGSACCPSEQNEQNLTPSIGLLHIRTGGEVEAEFIDIERPRI